MAKTDKTTIPKSRLYISSLQGHRKLLTGPRDIVTEDWPVLCQNKLAEGQAVYGTSLLLLDGRLRNLYHQKNFGFLRG